MPIAVVVVALLGLFALLGWSTYAGLRGGEQLSGRIPSVPARDGLTDRVEAGREGSQKGGHARQSPSRQSQFHGVWYGNTRQPNCTAADNRLQHGCRERSQQ